MLSVESLSTTATMMGVRLNSLYDPPFTAPCQPVPSSSFTMGGYRSTYFATASIAAASLLNRFATCSLTTSGGSSTSCPYFILLDTRPIASPKPAVFGPLCSSPCIQAFRVYNGTWRLTFIIADYYWTSQRVYGGRLRIELYYNNCSSFHTLPPSSDESLVFAIDIVWNDV